MIHSIWKYFELANSKSAFLEDLYINFLEFLDLERCNEQTVFEYAHHQSFRNIVLKDALLKQIITET